MTRALERWTRVQLKAKEGEIEPTGRWRQKEWDRGSPGHSTPAVRDVREKGDSQWGYNSIGTNWPSANQINFISHKLPRGAREGIAEDESWNNNGNPPYRQSYSPSRSSGDNVTPRARAQGDHGSPSFSLIIQGELNCWQIQSMLGRIHQVTLMIISWIDQKNGLGRVKTMTIGVNRLE